MVNRHAIPFVHMVCTCGLVDMGFTGPKFTWSNMRRGLENVQERLDRVFANALCIERLTSYQVIHLPRSRSDHNPIMVHGDIANRAKQHSTTFKVQAAWFQHPGFEQLVSNCWSSTATMDLLPTLAFLRNSITQWNQHTFGNSFDRKFRLLARIAGIQKKLAGQQIDHLEDMEARLRRDLDDTLR